MRYSDKVMEHFRNPQNMGEMEDPDGVGKVGNPRCGDIMFIYIRVEDDVIKDIKFQTMGCGAAIATSSVTTQMAEGKHIKEALKIERNEVAEALGGLPPQKMHCSNLAAEGLRDAIRDYLVKNGREGEAEEIKVREKFSGPTHKGQIVLFDKAE